LRYAWGQVSGNVFYISAMRREVNRATEVLWVIQKLLPVKHIHIFLFFISVHGWNFFTAILLAKGIPDIFAETAGLYPGGYLYPGYSSGNTASGNEWHPPP